MRQSACGEPDLTSYAGGREAQGDELLVVEFASDPPALSPGAVRAVLKMLQSAREKQARKNQEAEQDGRPFDGNPLPDRDVSNIRAVS